MPPKRKATAKKTTIDVEQPGTSRQTRSQTKAAAQPPPKKAAVTPKPKKAAVQPKPKKAAAQSKLKKAAAQPKPKKAAVKSRPQTRATRSKASAPSLAASAAQSRPGSRTRHQVARYEELSAEDPELVEPEVNVSIVGSNRTGPNTSQNLSAESSNSTDSSPIEDGRNIRSRLAMDNIIISESSEDEISPNVQREQQSEPLVEETAEELELEHNNLDPEEEYLAPDVAELTAILSNESSQDGDGEEDTEREEEAEVEERNDVEIEEEQEERAMEEALHPELLEEDSQDENEEEKPEQVQQPSTSKKTAHKKKRQTKNARLGLHFPITRFKKEFKSRHRMTLRDNAAIASAVFIDYMGREILGTVGDAATQKKNKRINPSAVSTAVRGDPLFRELFKNGTFVGSTYEPLLGSS